VDSSHQWYEWYWLGRLVLGAVGLFVFVKYGVPLAARRAWNREDRRQKRAVPPAELVEQNRDTAQDLGPDKAPFALDRFASTVGRVRDVFVQFSMNVETFGSMVSLDARGPWRSLEQIVDTTVGGIVNRNDADIQYLASCAKAHVDNWDVVRDSRMKSTVAV